MKIQDFSSVLNYAVLSSNEDYQRYFNENIQMASAYIANLCKESGLEEISEEQLNDLILDDYEKIIDRTYFNSYIYFYTMKIIAIKYLETHRSMIPDLKKEAREKGMVFDEEEQYTDDFHENLLLAVLSLEDDYNRYYENMLEKNGNFLDEINKFKDDFGQEEGFKRYCEKYGRLKQYPMATRRAFISYAYAIMFGPEGSREDLPANSPILKYKKTYSLKEYVTTIKDRIIDVYKDELIESIISVTYQIDRFGYISENKSTHDKKMNLINLPGLKYSEPEEETTDNPSVISLLKEKELSKLSIEVLLRMNSFYNNRLAKIVNDYAMSLFLLEETGALYDILNGETLAQDGLQQDVLDNLFLKYETLSIPMKRFYTDSQSSIANRDGRYEYEKKAIDLDTERNNKTSATIELSPFIKSVKDTWRGQYEDYFDERLPECDNDLESDLIFLNSLYNPVFLTYNYKTLAMKAEYAYMNYMEQSNPKLNLNFGIVLRNGEDLKKARNVIIASDGGLNFPNRLHTRKDDFINFTKSYTGSPLVRMYEGIDDFNYWGEYVTAQLLLPITRRQEKYLKNLVKGKVPEGDSNSKITRTEMKIW